MAITSTCRISFEPAAVCLSITQIAKVPTFSLTVYVLCSNPTTSEKTVDIYSILNLFTLGIIARMHCNIKYISMFPTYFGRKRDVLGIRPRLGPLLFA